MEKFVKIINVNDGNEKIHCNENRLYVESKTRTEKIVEAMLNNGWKLMASSQRINPAISGEGNYAFYLGGFDFIFEKDAVDGAVNDADEIIESVLDDMLAD
ncbi:MAG: hypothetical protein NC122_10935 [Faecalibacterium sp.]|nr:hypothetical protein [Ruminococcus sp.]MCM1393044.1 hypothetical protein [Ruminococcus sp.]MCM1486704.1 hypothetical protein [Faecalibacterium sp.]